MAFAEGGTDRFDMSLRIERQRERGEMGWSRPLSVEIEDRTRPFTQVRFNHVGEAMGWLAGYILAAGNGVFAGRSPRGAAYHPGAAKCMALNCTLDYPHGHDDTGEKIEAQDWTPDGRGRVRLPKSLDAEHWLNESVRLLEALSVAHASGDLAAASEAAYDYKQACDRMLLLEQDQGA